MDKKPFLKPNECARVGAYYDETNKIKGYRIAARDIVSITTPMLSVTAPTQITYTQTDDTTTTYTLTKVIGDVTYIQEYIVKVKGRGANNEEVESITLPDGQVILFKDWSIN